MSICPFLCLKKCFLENYYVHLDFESEITEHGHLHLKFDGSLNDNMNGFYRSKYTNAKGEEKYMATTQFESTAARKCFPCFDEPSIKSVYEVKLVVPEDRIALSNMNCISGNFEIQPNADPTKKKTVHFAHSPLMSTYLLCFIVGEFDWVEGKTQSGLPVRVYTPLGKKELGRLGLDCACKIIPLYENYFGEKYPLPKLDLISIPDFAAGAMENWGLITYRETALLYDPKQSSARVKQRVALVVAHECAHMWFGNLVTMEWWEQLWLNEGFATWVEYLAIDALYPEWNVFEQFVEGEYGAAQRLDSLASSHPIEVEINVADEIDEIFDNISYAKGCAVIRMLAEFVGLETFKKSLRRYIGRHKYGNTSSKDLWNAVSEETGKDIETLMNSWTRKMGYPLVVIQNNGVKTSNGKQQLDISQHRYFSGGPKEDQSLWNIPLGYVTSANPKTPVFAQMNEGTMKLEVDDSIKWIKFNPGQTGFYRVQYSSEYYKNLSAAIVSKELPPIDRLGLQNDVCALAKSGELPTTLALNILRSYNKETNCTVWSGVSTNLSMIWSLIKFEDWCEPFKVLAQQLYREIGQSLGWDAKPNESHLDTLLRATVIEQLGQFDDAETIKIAKQRFPAFVKDNSTIPADLHSALYSIILKNGGTEEYEQVMKIYYDPATLNEEKVRILGALGNSEANLEKLLTWGFSDQVKKQDTFYLFGSISANKRGRDLCWKFFQDNHAEFVKRYGGGLNFLSHFVKICTRFSTKEKADEVEKFFADHPVTEATRAVQQSVENIRANAAWLERESKDLQQYMQQFK